MFFCIYEISYICHNPRLYYRYKPSDRFFMDPLKFYKCLSDETRLRCMLLIQQEHELCVCELTEAIDEIQPKVSRHLAQLRKCGLLADRRQGQWVYYQINPRLPDWAKQVLSTTVEANSAFLVPNQERLSMMNNRPNKMKNCGEKQFLKTRD